MLLQGILLIVIQYSNKVLALYLRKAHYTVHKPIASKMSLMEDHNSMPVARESPQKWPK